MKRAGSSDQLRLARILSSPRLMRKYLALVPEYGVEASIEAVLSGERRKRKRGK